MALGTRRERAQERLLGAAIPFFVPTAKQLFPQIKLSLEVLHHRTELLPLSVEALVGIKKWKGQNFMLWLMPHDNEHSDSV